MIKYNLMNEMEAHFVLCEGRHDGAPTTDSIYPNTVPVMAFGKLELEAQKKLEPLVKDGLKRLFIYASGCQPALTAVLSTAWKLKVREVYVMHHDNALNGWQAQKINTLNDLAI